ncbi:carbohydrate ABC transporter permease [Pseudactinotalea sp. Z1739]|uniref:carbohydrate ABC transporter permease n=1 Tax=Pseudactinotalea sp. Z1739 TaxID=3413028 RepID=UPI003C7B2664
MSDVTSISRARGGYSKSGLLLRHGLLIAFGFLMLYPLLWMLKSSFTFEGEIFSGFGLIPAGATLDNYVRGWMISDFPLYLVNTIIVVVGCLVGNLIACALAAYAFARLQFRMRRPFFVLMLAGIMLPYHVVAVPQYIMFSAVDLVGDSFLPLIIPKLLATDAFFIFLMIQFLRGIPRELDAAAAIDGAGHYRTFWSIILPLMRPALLTTAIFTFIWTWNDFFSPLIYLTNPNSYTISLGLNALLDSETATGYGPLFAMSVLTLVPVFLFFLFAQKQLVQGIATTGTKG